MADLVIDVRGDSRQLQRTLRIIAKHAQACADELQQLDAQEQEPAGDGAEQPMPGP